MKKISMIFICLCAVLGVSAQTLTHLAYFPFSNNQGSPNTPTSYMAEFGEQVGTAGLYLDGTHGSSSWNQSDELTSNTGSDLNLLYGVAKGKDLATINSSANGKSIVFHFSTAGFQNVVLTLASRRSGQGFSSTVWSYSTDGTNFTIIEGASTIPTIVSNFQLQTLDFTGINAMNDQQNVYLRCTYDGALSQSASFRIDNVLIAAYPAGPDVWAPNVSSVLPLNESTISVNFNEEVAATTAENTANYIINNGVTVSNATLSGNMVTLTTTPMVEGSTYQLIVKDVADMAGNVMAADTFEFSYGVAAEFQCATIAELRTKLDFSDNSQNIQDNVEYKLTGEVVVTAVAAYNKQKVIQDATGAILIFDPNNMLDPNGSLEVGDKIKGIQGSLTNYFGFLEFKPTAAFEQKTAIYQEVEPLTITLAQLNDLSFMIQHQAELIQLNDVSFTEAGNLFTALTTYTIAQNGESATAVYPYFQDVDYLGTTVPSGTMNLVGFNFSTSKIGNNYPEYRYYIVPRTMNDFSTGIQEYRNTVAVYPNPAHDRVTFQGTTMVEHVSIFDANGKWIANEQVSDNTLVVSSLRRGIYFVKMYQHDEMLGVAKIVKF